MSAKEECLARLEEIAATVESKEQLHDMVNETIAEFVKDADAGQRAQFVAALRGKQHPIRERGSTPENRQWADWPAIVETAVAKLEA
jgi:hypothetical protein